MLVTVHSDPCLLLEAAELVYALVNDIPAEKLTTQGKFCIPTEQIKEIQQQACAALSLDDEQLQFYFRGIPVEGHIGRTSCLGCCLLYSSLDVFHSDVDSMSQAILDSWLDRRRRHYRITGIDAVSVNMEPSDGKTFTSLSEELSRLSVPQPYKMQLLEVFSAFEQHLAWVTDILRPVAAALEVLLAPWTKQAEPLIKQWEAFFEANKAEEFLFQRVHLKLETYDSLEIALRYIAPVGSPGKFDELTGRVCLHLGVGVQPSMEVLDTLPGLEEWEYATLRLLANADRVEMLRLMMTRPMGIPELSKQLHLNSGSVFRDVHSMYNAQLLVIQPEKGKSLYSTNLAAVSRVYKHLFSYLKGGEVQELP